MTLHAVTHLRQLPTVEITGGDVEITRGRRRLLPFRRFFALIREDVVIRQHLAWRSFRTRVSPSVLLARVEPRVKPRGIDSYLRTHFFTRFIRTFGLAILLLVFLIFFAFFPDPRASRSLSVDRKNSSREICKSTSRSLERVNCAHLRGHRSVNCKREIMPRLVIEVLGLRWKSMERVTSRWKIAPVRGLVYFTPLK